MWLKKAYYVTFCCNERKCCICIFRVRCAPVWCRTDFTFHCNRVPRLIWWTVAEQQHITTYSRRAKLTDSIVKCTFFWGQNCKIQATTVWSVWLLNANVTYDLRQCFVETQGVSLSSSHLMLLLLQKKKERVASSSNVCSQKKHQASARHQFTTCFPTLAGDCRTYWGLLHPWLPSRHHNWVAEKRKKQKKNRSHDTVVSSADWQLKWSRLKVRVH